MSRTRPRPAPLLLAMTSVALLALVTGCGAGQNAQTVKPFAPADGVLANSGNIRVLNALVVAADGARTGVVSMTLVNRGDTDDTLTGFTSPDGAVDLTGSRDLTAGHAVRFGATTEPAATIGDLAKVPGEEITLRLTFRHTEPITLRTVVVPAAGYYADLTPGPETPAELPTPTESTSLSSTASATP